MQFKKTGKNDMPSVRLWRSPKQLKKLLCGGRFLVRLWGAASPGGAGLPTNSNDVGPKTGELREHREKPD